MASRSLWNGTLAFGEVTIAVKLFAAVHDRGIHFHEVRLSDGCPIIHRRVGADSGREVPSERVTKAYETSRGHQVILSDDEIAAARGPRPKVIEIESFAPAGQIDPVYYDHPYIVGAQDGAERTYRMLVAALRRAERVGIGRFVLRSREQLVALSARENALILHTMRFADEVVRRSDLGVPALRREPSHKEGEMAHRLIDSLATQWRPGRHKDRYHQAVLSLIRRKAAGEDIEPPARQRREAPDDLLAALQGSLDGHKGRKRQSADGRRRKAGSRG